MFWVFRPCLLFMVCKRSFLRFWLGAPEPRPPWAPICIGGGYIKFPPVGGPLLLYMLEILSSSPEAVSPKA
jgi:hypothetical protein